MYGTDERHAGFTVVGVGVVTVDFACVVSDELPQDATKNAMASNAGKERKETRFDVVIWLATDH